MLKFLISGYKTIIVLLVLVCHQLKGQGLETALFRSRTTKLQFFIGPSLVSIRDNPQYQERGVTKIGYNFGVGISREISKYIELNILLSWARKGYKEEYFIETDTIINGIVVQIPALSGTVKNNFSNDYLAFAVSPQFQLYKELRLGVGGYYSWLNKSVNSNDYFYPSPHTFTRSSYGDFEDHDFGLSLNLIYSFPIRKRINLTVQAANYLGLKQISKFYFLGFPPMYNNAYTIKLGISFLRYQATDI